MEAIRPSAAAKPTAQETPVAYPGAASPSPGPDRDPPHVDHSPRGRLGGRGERPAQLGSGWVPASRPATAEPRRLRGAGPVPSSRSGCPSVLAVARSSRCICHEWCSYVRRNPEPPSSADNADDHGPRLDAVPCWLAIIVALIGGSEGDVLCPRGLTTAGGLNRVGNAELNDDVRPFLRLVGWR
jgi:hypothetical protein